MYRNTLAFFFCVLVHLQVLGQVATKKIKNQTNVYKETFYVLASNDTIKQGFYEKHIGRGLAEKGNYTSNIRTGVWDFFDFNGNIDLKYDYSRKVIVETTRSRQEDTVKYLIDTENGWTLTQVKRPAIVLQSPKEFGMIMQQNIRFPLEARNNGISGTVLVRFTIDENGKTSDYKVKKGIGYGCDQEAWRVIKMATESAQWLPAVYQDVPVKSEYVMPCVYKIQ